MNWIREHIPHLIGSGAIGGGTLVLVFREAIAKSWEEFWRERREARAERLAEHSRGDHAMTELISLLKEDIKAQRENDRKTTELLAQMVLANERSLDVQRTFSNQFSDADKRLSRIEGALRIQ